ncbi:MAG: YveK family protein [Chloroflexota bacterium]|jgi:capsular polysaccharide biosynthesis protein
MRLSEYIRIIRRRIWVIVLAVMVTAVAAYVFSKLQEPLYRSEASYLVVPNRNDNGLSIVLTNNMNSYKQLALARPQIEKISAQLQLDRSPEWLLEHISIQANADDRKMIVQVDYPDIDMAPRLANAVGENMAALVSSLNDGLEGTDKINMRITTPATPPQLYRPQTRINVLAGAFLGLIIGLLLAFVLDAIDDTLKNTEDVERHVGLTILGAIPASSTTNERRTNARKPA